MGMLKKNKKHERYKKIEKLYKSLFLKYNTCIIVDIKKIRSKQIHDIRKHIRRFGHMTISKKTMLKSFFKNSGEIRKDKWNKLYSRINGNIGFIFTNENVRKMYYVFKNFCLKSFAKSGSKSRKNVIIRKGIKRLMPCQTPFFQALGISTRISKGSIEIIDDVLVLGKGETLNGSHEALFKKLNLKPYKNMLNIKYIISNNRHVDLRVLKVDNDHMLHNILSQAKYLIHAFSIKKYILKMLIPFNIMYVAQRILSLSLFCKPINNN